MNKKIHLLTVLFFIFAVFANAVDIGLSPSSLTFSKMLKSGYAQAYTTVSTSSDENITGHIEIKGPIKDWLVLEPTNDTFAMSRKNPLRLKIISKPSADAANGMYQGTITFITDSVGKLSGSGNTIKAAVQLGVNNEIIGEQILSCQASGFRIEDIEFGRPLGISVSILNTGNVKINPTLTINVWDQGQKKLITSKEVILDELLPTMQNTYYRDVPINLEKGQYWINIGVKECNALNLLTFSVVDSGEISDKGKLIEILADRLVYVGTVMQLKGRFQNEGERTVNAKFFGEVRRGKRLISAIESPQVSVEPKEIVELTTFFTPDTSGKYTVSGRVLYNGKLTFQNSAEFEAVGEESLGLGKVTLYVLIYVAILLLIIFMIYLIRKERRKRHHRY